MEIHHFLKTASQKEATEGKQRIRLKEWTFDRYQGPPPERKWLIDGVLPLGVPGMVAAIGGAGKSMLLLDLAAKVALSEQGSMMPLEAIGGPITPVDGAAVLFTAEDDEDEIHRRCDHIVLGKPDPNRLIILPMPNIGGPRPLITMGREGPEFTSEYHNIREELLEINNLRLVVFDPLQNFAGGDVNSDPAAGSMFFSGLARIAAETGATTLVTHHFRKTGNSPITNSREAREAIRGTSALVDGGRWSYAIWEAERSEAEKICKQINRHYQPEIIFNGAVVKSNWPTDKTVRTYVRDPNSGLLIDRTLDLQCIETKQDNLFDSSLFIKCLGPASKRSAVYPYRW